VDVCPLPWLHYPPPLIVLTSTWQLLDDARIMTRLPTSYFHFGYSTTNSYGCPFACFRQASLFRTTLDSLSGSPSKQSKRTCRWNAGYRVYQLVVLVMMTQRRRLLSSPPLDPPARTMARPTDRHLVRGGRWPTCLMCRMAIAPAVDVRDQRAALRLPLPLVLHQRLHAVAMPRASGTRAQHLGRLPGTRKSIGRTTCAHARLLDPPLVSPAHG